jgi:hypothetical protein
MPEQRIFVQPASDRLVRFPDNRERVLKAEGEWVQNSTYWRRRIVGGDVFKAIPPIETETKKETSTNKKGGRE